MFERESIPTPEDGEIDKFNIRKQSPNALVRQAHATKSHPQLVNPIYQELLRRERKLESGLIDASDVELYEDLPDALAKVGSLLIDLRKASEAMHECLFNIGDEKVETQSIPLHDVIADKELVRENDTDFSAIIANAYKN